MKIFLFLNVFISWLICFRNSEYKNAKKKYIAYNCIILTLVSCLRGTGVGSDTAVYKNIYDVNAYETLKDLLDMFFNRYFNNQGTADVGYWLFMKLIHVFSDNFNVFLFFCAICFFIPLYYFLQKYSTHKIQLLFVFVLYNSLFYPIAMSGTRKEIALGMSIMFLYFYNEKKYIASVACFLFGFFIHMTSLIILIIPILNILYVKKLIKIIHIYTFTLIPFVILFCGKIILFMAQYVKNEHYEAYGLSEIRGGGITFIILLELVSFFCLFVFWNEEIDNNKFIDKYYATIPCFSFLGPLIYHNGSMIRLSQYFHIYILLLIPYALDLLFKNDKAKKELSYHLLILILIALSFKGDSESGSIGKYYFFWQQ